MARVTVEDCEEVVPNRFHLVALANQRVKQYQNGSPVTISRDNDKDPVLALREIAYKSIDVTELKESLINSLRNNMLLDDSDDYVEEDTYTPGALTVEHLSPNKTILSDDDDENIDTSSIIRDE